MTDRLRHSEDGYRRLLQISTASLVLIVEGRVDRYFYSELCAVTFGAAVSVDVRMAAELPVSTGGKPGALKFYDRARRRGMLLTDFKGKRTALLFCLDKDVDDITRRKRRSVHVMYTMMYEAENYLFVHGDVGRAIAAATRTPRDQIVTALPDNWRVLAAETWREWVVLCLTVQVLNVAAGSNYRVASRVNQPCDAATDLNVYAARLEEVQTRAGVDDIEFQRVIRRVRNTVARLYAFDQHDVVFRGKWYVTFINRWTIAATKHDIGEDTLVSMLLNSIDMNAPWADHLRQRLEEFVRYAGLIRAA